MSHILVVEDSPTQATVYERLFERAGHRVSRAAAPELALQICLQTTPDLVVLDQSLGEHDGLEVCQRLKGDIAMQLIPVLVLTATATERDHLAALEAGADAFLPKDSSNEQLLAVVDRLLETVLPVQPLDRHPDAHNSFLRGARILVVDDSETYLNRLCDTLREDGLHVTGVTSPEEGLELVEHESYEVGVIDIVMPQMDGFEVCRRIREWADRNHKHIGLLVMTGRESSDIPVQSYEAGADDFVSKMHDFEILVAHVRALVRRVRMMRHIHAINRKTHLHEMALKEAEWKREQAEVRAQHADELRRSNEELERFAYVVAHDLKAPLRTVAGYCQLIDKLTKDNRDERADEYIGKTLLGTERMGAIIDDLLRYSRVNKSETPPDTTDCNLVFRHAVANLQSEIDESGASVAAGDCRP